MRYIVGSTEHSSGPLFFLASFAPRRIRSSEREEVIDLSLIVEVGEDVEKPHQYPFAPPRFKCASSVILNVLIKVDRHTYWAGHINSRILAKRINSDSRLRNDCRKPGNLMSMRSKKKTLPGDAERESSGNSTYEIWIFWT
jgi:hypothetical protein